MILWDRSSSRIIHWKEFAKSTLSPWLGLRFMCSHFCWGSLFQWQLWLFALTALVVAAACEKCQISMSSIVPGRSGFVKYQVGAAAPFHERLLLAKAHGIHWSVATPDLAVYVENIMDPVSLDETFASIAANGTMPRLVAGATRTLSATSPTSSVRPVGAWFKRAWMQLTCNVASWSRIGCFTMRPWIR